jgi:hypothetical protein
MDCRITQDLLAGADGPHPLTPSPASGAKRAPTALKQNYAFVLLAACAPHMLRTQHCRIRVTR